jgi:hypothetical protein
MDGGCEVTMAHRNVVFGLALLVSACGGRFESSDPSGGTTGAGGTAGGGGSVAGSGGSTGVGGSTAIGGSMGGQNAGGSPGVGGSGAAGGTDIRACVSPADCTLEMVDCCPLWCEPAPLSKFTAVNNKYVTQRCATIDCYPASCGSVPPEQKSTPYFAATCLAGRCEAIDVRTLGMADCDSSADCYLRMGTDCCEPCVSSPALPVALSRKVDFSPLLCGSGPIACAACMPVIPSDLFAACSLTEKKCVVRQLGVVDAGVTPY